MSSYCVDGELRFQPNIGAPVKTSTLPTPVLRILHLLVRHIDGDPLLLRSHGFILREDQIQAQRNQYPLGFKNTATISKNLGSKSIASLLKQGSGRINVWNVTTTTNISSDCLDLLDTENCLSVQTITIKRGQEDRNLHIVPRCCRRVELLCQPRYMTPRQPHN